MQLRDAMLREEREQTSLLRSVPPVHREGLRNLLHDAVLRSQRVSLNAQLRRHGLMDVHDEAEPLIGQLERMINLTKRLEGTNPARTGKDSRVDERGGGAQRRARGADRLFGRGAPGTGPRLMVTLDRDTGGDPAIVRNLLRAGADCVRVNCARDSHTVWTQMIRAVRRAGSEQAKRCPVFLDLGGRKLRTGPIQPATPVIKIRPLRDGNGLVRRPATVALVTQNARTTASRNGDYVLPVEGDRLITLRPGEQLTFRDARHARRTFRVRSVHPDQVIVESAKSCYLRAGMELRIRSVSGFARQRQGDRIVIGVLPSDQAGIPLSIGDTLILVGRPVMGAPAAYNETGRPRLPALIGTTVRANLERISPGEKIWFDDGKICAIVRHRVGDRLHLLVTLVRGGRRLLYSQRGINIPGVDVGIPAMTRKDRNDLRYALKKGNIVALSFVRSGADLTKLIRAILKEQRPGTGVILKIENREAVRRLDELLATLMRMRRIGVLIARGDLAVECGYEELAVIQEEILRRCRIARVPVVVATEVLESVSRRGVPTRGELTDAMWAAQTECVLVSKGPHETEAIRLLRGLKRPGGKSTLNGYARPKA